MNIHLSTLGTILVMYITQTEGAAACWQAQLLMVEDTDRIRQLCGGSVHYHSPHNHFPLSPSPPSPSPIPPSPSPPPPSPSVRLKALGSNLEKYYV